MKKRPASRPKDSERILAEINLMLQKKDGRMSAHRPLGTHSDGVRIELILRSDTKE